MSTVTVKGLSAFFFLTNLDNYGKYSIEITHLDDDSVARLEAAGLGHRVKQDDQATVDKLVAEGKKAFFKDRFIRARSGRVIPAVDREGNAVTVPIGRGSKVQAILKPFTYTNYGGGTSAGAEKVLIEELVELEAQDGEAPQEGSSEASASGFID